MALTHALYYPWIDIENTDWLKTTILYWENISTIMPFGMENPYRSPETSMLFQEHILEPFAVYPYMPAVIKAEMKMKSYLNTDEAKTLITKGGLTKAVMPFVGDDSGFIYSQKMSPELKELFLRSELAIERNGILIMDRSVANYYMSVLAAMISEEQRWGLLTNSSPHEDLTNRVRRGDLDLLHNNFSYNLAQGVLAKIVLQTIKIAPNTPLETILDFRQRHSDNLRIFRNGIENITFKIDPNTRSSQEFYDQVNNVYEQEVAPSIKQLRDELKNAKIEVVFGSLFSLLFIGIGAFVNQVNPDSFTLIKEGFQLVAKPISYHRRKQQILRNNPWSYVLSAEEELS